MKTFFHKFSQFNEKCARAKESCAKNNTNNLKRTTIFAKVLEACSRVTRNI